MKSFAAVVILYNPEIDILLKNIKLLKSQVDYVYLIDNSGSVLDVSITDLDYVKYCFNNDNLGIAEAQNIGIKLAQKEGVDYVTLFDQDSHLTENFIDGLYASFNVASNHRIKLACVGPRIIDVFTNNKVTPFIQRDSYSVENITICSQIIASGKMVDIKVLNEIGLMESQLFIDGVDHEWCWRARSRGFSVAINEDVKMVHQLGESKKSFLGIKYTVSSPIRLYYQFRNILILSRRNYVPMYWKIRSLLSIPVRYIILSLTDDDSSRIIAYMNKGLIDGFRKKYGKYTQHLK